MSRRTKQLFKKAISAEASDWFVRLPARLGNIDGAVETGTRGLYHARLAFSGQPVEVQNLIGTPPTFDLHVIVGSTKLQPSVWLIVEQLEDYDEPATSGEIQYHASQHGWNHGDMLAVDPRQITYLSAQVADGAAFLLNVYGGFLLTSDGAYVQVDNQTLDLSGYALTAGAKLAVIEADVDGVLSVNLGSDFGAPELATVASLPAPASYKQPVFAVLLYENQEELSNDDIMYLSPYRLPSDSAPYDDPTAANDFLIGEQVAGVWTWVKKTLAQTVTILRTSLDSVYAAAANGVTGGDSHDHSGGDGGTIAYSSLSGTPTIRETLTADRTYYVRTDGSDSNTGLANTAGGAFLTIQKAIDTAATLDTSTYNVTIQVGNGTYSEALVAKLCVGSGSVTILGDASTPSNVAATSLKSSISTPYVINGFTLSGGVHSIWAEVQGVISFLNIDFGTCTGAQVRASDGGAVTGNSNYTISAGSQLHTDTISAGVITIQNKTITITGTPAFSVAFSRARISSAIIISANTFSGSATGKRYDASSNGIIYTNGAASTYLPGNVAGTTATGGQYA